MKNILVSLSFLFLFLLAGCAKENVEPKDARKRAESDLSVIPSGIRFTTYYQGPTFYYNEVSRIAIYDITGHTVDIFNPAYPPDNGVILDKLTGEKITAAVLKRDWTYDGLHAPNRRYLVYVKSTTTPKYSYIYFTLPEQKYAEILFRYQLETQYAKPASITFQ